VGDHVIVDFGAVCMRVVDFEDEADFLHSKQLDGLEVTLNYIIYSLVQVKYPRDQAGEDLYIFSGE